MEGRGTPRDDADPKDVTMSIQEDGTYDEDAARRSRRRKQAVVGAAGAAAVLAGGAFFATEAIQARHTSTPEIAAAPMAVPSSASAKVTAKTSEKTPGSHAPAAKASRLTSATPTP